MPGNLSEAEWLDLLKGIRDGKCTAFLGAGVNDGILPLGKDIAEKWAKEFGYPLGDCTDLVRVAQFLAVTVNPACPKRFVLDLIKECIDAWRKSGADRVQLTARDEPLSLLADLPIPIYITTNYDDLLMSALKVEERRKSPRREVCCWNKYMRKILQQQGKSSIFVAEPDFPTAAKPVVFHLHGHDELPESIVIAEVDYLEFLVNMTRNPKLLPKPIEGAIASTSLLFVGYSLADWDFKVLWQLLKPVDQLAHSLSVAVQLPPWESSAASPNPAGYAVASNKVEEYLRDYFKNINVKVYWGTAKGFSKELRDRWEKFCRG
jgi:hypothetical protein